MILTDEQYHELLDAFRQSTNCTWTHLHVDGVATNIIMAGEPSDEQYSELVECHDGPHDARFIEAAHRYILELLTELIWLRKDKARLDKLQQAANSGHVTMMLEAGTGTLLAIKQPLTNPNDIKIINDQPLRTAIDLL